MYGFDVAGCPRIIAQGFAELTHTYGKRSIGNTDLGPDGSPELILGHQLAGMLHQMAKHIEGLRRQHDRLLAPPQGRVGYIQVEGTKDKHAPLTTFQGLEKSCRNLVTSLRLGLLTLLQVSSRKQANKQIGCTDR